MSEDRYKIIVEITVVDLEKAVNEAIVEGWTPLGGPTLGINGQVMQAMILI